MRISYGELAERVAAFGSLLLREGFAPGEVAGICIRDEVGHLVAAMAVLCMNTPQISLGSHESGSTRRALAERVGVTQLIVEAAEDWMEGLRIITMPKAGVDVGGGSRSNLRPDASQALDSIAIYQNTSGSTGIPKTFGISLERLEYLINALC